MPGQSPASTSQRVGVSKGWGEQGLERVVVAVKWYAVTYLLAKVQQGDHPHELGDEPAFVINRLASPCMRPVAFANSNRHTYPIGLEISCIRSLGWLVV